MNLKTTNKGFIKGLIAGATLTAASLVGYAYGLTANHDQDAGEYQTLPVSDRTSGLCSVQTGLPQLSVSDRCSINQVMVGLRQGYLLCADLQVSCP